MPQDKNQTGETGLKQSSENSWLQVTINSGKICILSQMSLSTMSFSVNSMPLVHASTTSPVPADQSAARDRTATNYFVASPHTQGIPDTGKTTLMLRNEKPKIPYIVRPISAHSMPLVLSSTNASSTVGPSVANMTPSPQVQCTTAALEKEPTATQDDAESVSLLAGEKLTVYLCSELAIA